MGQKTKIFILIFGDIFFFYFSLFLTLILRYGKNFKFELFFQHLLPFSFLYFFQILLFYIFDLYDLRTLQPKISFYSKLLGTLGGGAILGVILFYLFPFFGITPKTNLALNFLILAFFLSIWRKIFFEFLNFLHQNKVAILGINSFTLELAKEIEKRPYLGYQLKAFLEKKDYYKKPPLQGIKIIKVDEDLPSKLKKEKITSLILGKKLKSKSPSIKILYHCLKEKIKIFDFEKIYEIVFQKVPLGFLDEIWFLENLKEGEKIVYDKMKRLIDIFLAFFILIFTLPFWFLISLAIFLETGPPIFYLQKRIGKDKKEFLLFKFRSMKVGAERKGKPKWAKEKDPRVTKVGKFLRRFHLDELPQMINVLKGEISLVGPRPERPEFVKKLEKEIPYYHLRHIIKPGFTGWAQIKFRYARSVLDSFEKFQYDLYYIKNRSFLFDLSILLKTLQLFFRKEK